MDILLPSFDVFPMKNRKTRKKRKIFEDYDDDRIISENRSSSQMSQEMMQRQSLVD